MAFNIETATLQEACDYAVLKIVEQGKQCYQYGYCAYSDASGNHCAVGWLLDEKSDAMIFEGDIYDLIYSHNDIPELITDNQNVFDCLQRFHDLEGKEDRIATMLSMEKVYNISVSAPQWNQWVNMGIK